MLEVFAPEQCTVDTVRTWLIDSGVDASRITHSDNKDWLAFDATTEEAETLLLTEYHLYEHVDGHVTPACERYHIPKNIQEQLDYITPEIRLLALNKRRTKRSFLSKNGFSAPLSMAMSGELSQTSIDGPVHLRPIDNASLRQSFVWISSSLFPFSALRRYVTYSKPSIPLRASPRVVVTATSRISRDSHFLFSNSSPSYLREICWLKGIWL